MATSCLIISCSININPPHQDSLVAFFWKSYKGVLVVWWFFLKLIFAFMQLFSDFLRLLPAEIMYYSMHSHVLHPSTDILGVKTFKVFPGPAGLGSHSSRNSACSNMLLIRYQAKTDSRIYKTASICKHQFCLTTVLFIMCYRKVLYMNIRVIFYISLRCAMHSSVSLSQFLKEWRKAEKLKIPEWQR